MDPNPASGGVGQAWSDLKFGWTLVDGSLSASPYPPAQMSKKKSSGGSTNSVRREIQRLDRDLLKALSDRARAVQKLAKIRQNEKLPLYDLTEEQEALAELLPQNKGPLSADALRNIYR